MRQIEGIVMHCDAMIKSNNQEELNHFYEHYWKLNNRQIDLLQGTTDEFEIITRLFHKINQWKSPGYHVYIKENADTIQMHPYDLISNGVKGWNKKIINICVHGGVLKDGGRYIDNTDTRSEDQKASEISAILEAIHYEGVDNSIWIKGHRDLSPDKNGDGIVSQSEWLKTCPNYDVQKEHGWITA